MKLNFLLVVLCTILAVRAMQNEDKNIKFEGEGSGSEDGNESITSILKKTNEVIDDTERSGDGEDDESSAGSTLDKDFSGGSAYSTVQPTMKKDDKADKTTPAVVDITVVPTRTDTTMGNDVEHGDETGNAGGENVDGSTKSPNAIIQLQESGNSDKKSGVNFTVGIIIGVVVGAILAILIIVFLVYRLRKKDEGSYSLDEQSSTVYLRADADSPTKGKEYFA